MKQIMKILQAIAMISMVTSTLNAYEAMYEKTRVDKIEIKTISERTALEASTQGNYFRGNNGLFRRLFRYISDEEVEMTVPVEADVNPGKMRFFVGKEDRQKSLSSKEGVKVFTMPKLTVVSIGIRGSYSEDRFRKNEKKLLEWLKKQKKYEKAGSAYAVYWNGPFVPGIFKRSEVHVPIRKKPKKKENRTQPDK